MNKGLKTGLIIGVVVVVLVMLFAGSYNGLIGKEEEVDSKLAQVSVQLERRADLIPNLVNTVKGYASHEQSVISKWLKKRDNYHWVQFNEEGFEDIAYKVQTNLAPYLFNGKVIGYNVTMTSNCGYGFSNEIIIEETIDKNKPLYINLHNDTDSYSFPLIKS